MTKVRCPARKPEVCAGELEAVLGNRVLGRAEYRVQAGAQDAGAAAADQRGGRSRGGAQDRARGERDRRRRPRPVRQPPDPGALGRRRLSRPRRAGRGRGPWRRRGGRRLGRSARAASPRRPSRRAQQSNAGLGDHRPQPLDDLGGARRCRRRAAAGRTPRPRSGRGCRTGAQRRPSSPPAPAAAASPATWPCSSLNCLKWSRSSIATHSGPSRRARSELAVELLEPGTPVGEPGERVGAGELDRLDQQRLALELELAPRRDQRRDHAGGERDRHHHQQPVGGGVGLLGRLGCATSATA